jgi:hypothetical protein
MDNQPKINMGSIESENKDKDILSKTSRFEKSESSRIKKAELNDDVNTQPVIKPKEALNSGEGVLDPMTLRDSDTSKLKKIKPKSSTQTISLDSDNISDTVHLKVIKEKKKQLAGILTASQTIRLRPPSQDSGKTAPPQSAQTLKLNNTPPGGIINMPPAGSPAGTLKINMPATSSESGTIKVSKPNFADSGSAAGTLKIKSPVAVDTAGGSGTLKIKSTNATVSASGTLKLKAAPGNDATVKLDGDDKKGGTLKLKPKAGGATVSSGPQSVRQSQSSAQEEYYEQAPADDPKAKPGIFMTLSSLVAIGTIGFTVFQLVDNYMKLFTEYK